MVDRATQGYPTANDVLQSLAGGQAGRRQLLEFHPHPPVHTTLNSMRSLLDQIGLCRQAGLSGSRRFPYGSIPSSLCGPPSRSLVPVVDGLPVAPSHPPPTGAGNLNLDIRSLQIQLEALRSPQELLRELDPVRFRSRVDKCKLWLLDSFSQGIYTIQCQISAYSMSDVEQQ